MNDSIEQQIRQILVTETRAVTLSAKLFSPHGLFHQMASSEAERRVVVQSPLFQQALARLSELQAAEGAQFAQAVEQAKGTMPETGYLVQVIRTEVA